MRSEAPSPSALSVAGLYLFGVLLFFWPFADLISNALPAQLGSLNWRYGFAGLMAAYLSTPTLGLVLLMAVAYWMRHLRTLRLLSVFEILMAVGIVAIMVVFALDLLQVRASRPEPARPAVLAGGLIALAKHFTSVVVLMLLGFGGWRTANSWVGEAKEAEAGAARIVMKGKHATPEPLS
jgi:chromate transport protein ChrA